jgi:hypothetical protein
MRRRKKVAFVMIHGMGETERGYYQVFTDRLSKFLGETDWGKVAFKSLYYQDILQENQNIIFGRSRDLVAWRALRKFVLFAFSDAASLEYENEEKNSPYYRTQFMIRRTLRQLYRQVEEDAPVVLLAYSLGCHVISNYIWDAQQRDSDYGIWFHGRKPAMTAPEENFARLRNLQRLFTVGCNIPVFVAGHKRIRPFSRPHRHFEWVNLYDKDDVLGWPLRPLSRQYGELVKEDVLINAHGGLWGWLAKSWNPLSHKEYFYDPEVVRRVGESIKQLL